MFLSLQNKKIHGHTDKALKAVPFELDCVLCSVQAQNHSVCPLFAAEHHWRQVEEQPLQRGENGEENE